MKKICKRRRQKANTQQQEQGKGKRGVGKELTNYPIISFKLHCFTAAGIAVAAGCGVGGDSDSDDVKWLKKCEQNEKAHKTEYNENNNNNNNEPSLVKCLAET